MSATSHPLPEAQVARRGGRSPRGEYYLDTKDEIGGSRPSQDPRYQLITGSSLTTPDPALDAGSLQK